MVNFYDKTRILSDFPNMEKVFIGKYWFFEKKRLQLLVDFCIIVQVDYSEDARGC